MPKRTTAATAPIETPTPQGEYRRVPLDAVIESPLNPRKHMDEDALHELVESIRLHDVIEPIVVRTSPHELERFEVVAGARRTRAARLAGRVDVPVMVRNVTDAQLLELALQENLHRASMTPLDEARALETLASLDPIYRDDRVLAGKIGRSETYVRDRRKLLRLDPLVQDALEGGAITAKHAERIARLPVDQHTAALEACFSMLTLGSDESRKVWSAEVARGNREGLPTLKGENDALLRARRWDLLAPGVVSLREFDEWVQDNGKVDLAAPEIQEQLRPVLDDIAANNSDVDPDDDQAMDEMRQAATASFLQLSEDPGLAAADAAELNVVPFGRWKEITRAKDTCDFTQRAAIVHGGSFRLVDVCTESRKCQSHWPKPKKAKGGTSSSGGYDWKAEAEKRKKAQAEWDAVRPRYVAALVAHTKGFKVTTARIAAALESWKVTTVASDFGVKLTDATAGQVLALTTVSTDALDAFAKDAKALGLNVAKVTATIKAEAKKAGGAAPTPAKARAKGKAKK
jgi:ParB/RepB/Spo0J family partition protein